MTQKTGDRLRALRQRAGLSRAQLAKMCGVAGMTTVQYWEAGDRPGSKPLPGHVVVMLAGALVGRGNPPITPAEIAALGDGSAALILPANDIQRVALYAWGALLSLDTAQPVEIISVSVASSGDIIAAAIIDDHAARIAPAGSRVIIDRAAQTLIDGRCYVIADTGRVMLRRYRQNPARFESEAIDREETLFPSGPVVIVGQAISVITSL